MAMVRRGVMFTLREASCCKVEVVKGGEGERCLSLRLTEVTAKAAPCSASVISRTSSSLASSFFLPPTP